MFQSPQRVVYGAQGPNGVSCTITRLKYPSGILQNLSETRFVRALVALKNLQHPCLRPVFDGGLDSVDQSPWVATISWPGESLEERLQEGKITPETSHLVEKNAQLVVNGLKNDKGVVSFDPRDVILTKAADGNFLESFVMDYHSWFQDWATGKQATEVRDPMGDLSALLDSLDPARQAKIKIQSPSSSSPPINQSSAAPVLSPSVASAATPVAPASSPDPGLMPQSPPSNGGGVGGAMPVSPPVPIPPPVPVGGALASPPVSATSVSPPAPINTPVPAVNNPVPIVKTPAMPVRESPLKPAGSPSTAVIRRSSPNAPPPPQPVYVSPVPGGPQTTSILNTMKSISSPQPTGPISGPLGGAISGPIGGPISGPLGGPISGPITGPITGPISGPLGRRAPGPMSATPYTSRAVLRGEVAAPRQGMPNPPPSASKAPLIIGTLLGVLGIMGGATFWFMNRGEKNAASAAAREQAPPVAVVDPTPAEPPPKARVNPRLKPKAVIEDSPPLAQVVPDRRAETTNVSNPVPDASPAVAKTEKLDFTSGKIYQLSDEKALYKMLNEKIYFSGKVMEVKTHGDNTYLKFKLAKPQVAARVNFKGVTDPALTLDYVKELQGYTVKVLGRIDLEQQGRLVVKFNSKDRIEIVSE